MRHVVLGTAGHIDHGKTALVKAITGINTDRLDEEKRRGITIELGFAPWKLADDLEASIVDVPGHERLVRTMVAGAAGIDVAMLVIAADDGVMPQTREHLDVLRLLAVPAGVIVVSKCDLADDEVLELVEEDIRETVAGTLFEGAPLVRTSSKNGTGLDELREVIGARAQAAEMRSAEGPAFLPLDRLFTKAGHGTIGTGTTLRGTLRVGDTLQAFGEGARPVDDLKVRGLQALGTDRQEALAGMRTAVNLTGRNVELVKRGMVVATAGAFEATDSAIAWVEVLAGAGALEEETLTCHLGTSERQTRIIPLGAERLQPGSSGGLLLRFEHPIAAYAGQRLVLRRPGLHGQATVGGGEILDPVPPTGKGAVSLAASQLDKLRGAPKERLAAIARESRSRGITPADVARRLPAGHADVSIRTLEKKGQLKRIPGQEERWIDGALADTLASQVVALVTAAHDKNPMSPGLKEAEVQSQLPPPEQHLAALAVEHALSQKKITRADLHLSIPGRGTSLDDRAKRDIARIKAAIADAKYTPPAHSELANTLDLDPKRLQELLGLMRRRKEVVKVSDSLHYAANTIQEIETKVIEALTGGSELTASALKEMIGGASRKWAIPVLEYLDRTHVTLRVGDVRKLHPSRK